MTQQQRLILTALMWTASFAVIGVMVVTAPEEEPWVRLSEGYPVTRYVDPTSVEAVGPFEVQGSLTTHAPHGAPALFRGGLRHTGRSSFRGPESATLLWTFQADGPIKAQPVFDSDGSAYFGTLAGTFYSVDAQGALRWKADLGAAVYSTALVGKNGLIYVGCDGDRLHAFSADGSRPFSVPTRGDADTGIVEGAEGLVYFAAGSDLWAILHDGTVQWRFEAAEKIFSTPAIGFDGTLYFGAQDDHLYAVDRSGQLRWRFKTNGDNDAAPAIGDDGTIYYGSDDGRVYALARDGTLRWKSEDLGGFVRAPLGLGLDQLVIAGVMGPRPRLTALDGATGQLVWYFPIELADSAQVGVESGVVIDREGRIFFGAFDEHVYALESNGQFRFAFPTRADVDGTPSLPAEAQLVVGADDGTLYAWATEVRPRVESEQVSAAEEPR